MVQVHILTGNDADGLTAQANAILQELPRAFCTIEDVKLGYSAVETGTTGPTATTAVLIIYETL